MYQNQLLQLRRPVACLRPAFWGRDSIVTALTLHLAVGILTGNLILSPLVRWLGDMPEIGSTRQIGRAHV